jgi:uncharacterized protein involved in oxidation of intracellular sulfur
MEENQKREEKILYISTCGGDDPEKASMPFVLAGAALAMDIKATICLQGNAVYLAQKGFADHVLPGGGFPPMKKLIQDFIELGGKMLVCVPCIKKRNIAETELIDGAETTAAGAVNIEAMTSNAVLVY